MASRLENLKALAKAAGYNLTNNIEQVLPEDYPLLRAYLAFEKGIPACTFSDVELELAGIEREDEEGKEDPDPVPEPEPEPKETSEVGEAVVGEPESDSDNKEE